MKWTAEQQRVIAERDKNILVSAAAGSGKTAVLTERIVSLLKEGHDLDDFLIFTFTVASAKDMKEKIRRALQATPGMQVQEKKLSTANISTIDSFCHSVVRDHFYDLDIDPNFRTADPTEVEILQNELLSEFFDALYAAEDPSFLELVELFSADRSDDNLKQAILQLERFFSNKVDRQAAYAQALAGFEDKAYWEAQYKQYVEERYQAMENALEEARILAFNDKVSSTLESDAQVLRHPAAVFVRYPSLSKIEKEDEDIVRANEAIKSLRDTYKKMYKELCTELGKFGTFDEGFVAFQTQKPRIEALISLTDAFYEHFYAERKERGFLSFSDVAHLALKALQNEAIASQYRERFKFIFIDEYQDTNPIQEALIQAMTRGNNVFMVGDIKQSIYRFRQADPSIFLNKYKSYAQGDHHCIRIDLNRNFRSASPIIEAVNRLFERVMVEEFGGIVYDNNTRLIFGNETLKDVADEVELLITEEVPDKIEAELTTIMERILKLRQEGYRYKDIAILMRSPVRVKDQAIKAFKDAGIPLLLDYSSAYLNSNEVAILLNYLKVIDNFNQDLPLLSLLRLPRYGLSDQDLFTIRRTSAKEPIHRAVLSPLLPKEIRDRLLFFLDEMEEFRRKSRYLNIDALLQDIYYQTEYENFILTMHDGKQRLANVRLLFHLAGQYEETSFVGLHRFLRYVDKVAENKSDFETARTISEDSDAVHLMSIHKSKGLQFPVVFVAEMHKGYNEMDTRGNLLTEGEHVVMNEIDLEKRTSKVPLFKRILQGRLRDAARQEEVRLLYVAMTRAEKKLILSGYLTSLEQYLMKGLKSHTPTQLKGCTSYFDLLFGAMIVDRDKQTEAPFRLMDRTTLANLQPVAADTKVYASGRSIVPVMFTHRKADSKYSVSKLVHQDTAVPRLMTELEENLIGGMKKGILFHKAMEWIDHQDVEGSLKSLIERKVLVDFEDYALVDTFLGHKIMQDYLARALKIERELPFVYRTEVMGEETLIQGIIDLIIHLPEGVVLIDYKTDIGKAYLESYKAQVNHYTRAYQAIRGQAVIQRLIWFVRLGEFVEVQDDLQSL